VSAEFEATRRQILENDRRIVEAVNERLRLVSALWELKARLDLPQFDPGREDALRRSLAETNGGPLSAEGLDRLVTELLALTRDELAGMQPGR
jgi:chorismate mutase